MTAIDYGFGTVDLKLGLPGTKIIRLSFLRVGLVHLLLSRSRNRLKRWHQTQVYALGLNTQNVSVLGTRRADEGHSSPWGDESRSDSDTVHAVLG